MMKPPDITMSVGLVAAVALALGFALAKSGEVPAETVLVGTGCEGQSSVAVARFEDHLPRCASIAVHEVRTSDPYATEGAHQ